MEEPPGCLAVVRIARTFTLHLATRCSTNAEVGVPEANVPGRPGSNVDLNLEQKNILATTEHRRKKEIMSYQFAARKNICHSEHHVADLRDAHIARVAYPEHGARS